MRTQVCIETAARSVQGIEGVGHSFASSADRIEGRRARVAPPVYLEPDGHRWRVRIGSCLTLHGDTPAEVMALAAVLLSHTPTGCASAAPAV